MRNAVFFLGLCLLNLGGCGASKPKQATPSFVSALPRTLPTIAKNGNAILANPKVRVVTFNDDPNAAEIESFAAQLARSSYWSEVTQEYGVGRLQAGPPIRAQYAWPTAVGPSDYEAYLISQLDGASPAWGAPDSNTIYALTLPAGVQVTSGNDTICQNTGAWHGAILLPASQVMVPYSLSVECPPLDIAIPAGTFVPPITVALSHEWVEAATDAYGGQGYDHFDDSDYADEVFFQGDTELADACVLRPAIQVDGIWVQRVWSNQASLAGHDPCVPAPAGDAFFEAVPVFTDTAQVVEWDGKTHTVAAFKLVNGRGTIPLKIFSDVRVAEGFRVAAFAYQLAEGQWAGPSSCECITRPTSGNNGDTVQLSVSCSDPNEQPLIEVHTALKQNGDNVPWNMTVLLGM